MLNSLRELFKTNIYAIVTALILAAAITGYLLVILPMHKGDEDQRNAAVFRNVQEQLLGYVDDQAKAISERRIVGDSLKGFRLSNGVKKPDGDNDLIIKSVVVRSANIVPGKPGTIRLWRKVTFMRDKVQDTLIDPIEIDLKPFFRQMSPMKKFEAFYLSKVLEGKCVPDPLIAENINVKDQNDLTAHCQEEGVHHFEKSSKRYYTAQFAVAPNLKLYMAAGFDNAQFDSAVRSVSPALLIFSLMVIILLVLSLSLIKPILSDDKERMSQRDFVSVAFCTGALIAVLVTFWMVSSWGSLLKDKNHNDLKKLTDSVSLYFSRDLTAHKDDRDGVVKGAPPFAKMKMVGQALWFQQDSLGDSTCVNVRDMPFFNRLQEYFTMDSTGLITSNRNKEYPGLKRVYKDREYFRLLKDNPLYGKVLTAVLSRRDHTYQWIFAEKDNHGGLSGIAFKDKLSRQIKVPNGTAYMIVRGNGDILFQDDPGKVLRGNVLEGTSNEAKLQRLLAGNDTGAFTTEYQGVKYQMYGQKLREKVPDSIWSRNKEDMDPDNDQEYLALSDNPVYIIAMRDLSFQQSLSLFSFTNTFLITLLYGIFIMLLMMAYSMTLYSGRLSIFSKEHLSYLFPDNSRTKEYRLLYQINAITIVAIAAAAFLIPASWALWCCFIAGVNIAFLNFALLNSHNNSIRQLLHKLCWWMGLVAVISFTAILSGYFTLALLLTLTLHFYLIVRHKQSLARNQDTEMRLNEGVNRKHYSRFFAVVLLKHFGLLPFLLCTTIYISELNDVSAWYCASMGEGERSCVIDANGCGCNPDTKMEVSFPDKLARHLDLGLLGRPSNRELDDVSFADPERIHYVQTKDALSHLDGVERVITIMLLLLAMSLVYFLTKALIDYYSNRFFFYSLMQAAYEHYYPTEKPDLPLQNAWPCLHLPARDAGVPENPEDNGIPVLFAADPYHNLLPMHREEFALHENLNKFEPDYRKAWQELPRAYHNALFDFARDHFLNYKNRDQLVDLMELEIINAHPETGRLQVANAVFRAYIVQTYRKDPEFIAIFNEESKDGFFMKLRLPLIIIAISLLVLLLYLNQESFSELLAFGTAITTTLGMVNNMMKGQKPVS